VRMDGRTATVEGLRAASDGGLLTGGGTVRLGPAGATVLDLHAELAALPLFANEYGSGAASGRVRLSGTTAAPSVEGTLEAHGLVLRIPEILPDEVRPPDPTIVVIGPGAPAPPAEAAAADGAAPVPAPALYDRATIRLRLEVPRNAWLRRSDANIALRGWMEARKRPGDELRLAGEINAVRGWYAFQGKKFTLAEGQVTFTGQELDPLLRLVALHRAGEYVVRVIVGGTITRPELRLESDPPLEQADILSVLLFGRPASRLGAGESAGLREQAIGVAGSYVAKELRESVADALGLDALELEAGARGVEDGQVAIGKYLGEDILVTLAHRFGAQAVNELRVEYSLSPQWSIESSTDTLGRSGIDLFWKRRY
jgi:translocation and assembly module TamB